MITIFLDIDGVLANFDGEIVSTFGKHYAELDYDVAARWHKIAARRPNIFAELSKMPDADLLVDGVTSLCDEYECHLSVLTAVPVYGVASGAFTLERVRDQKRAWIAERWPHLADVVRIGPYAVDKQNHVKVGDVLIDDSTLNIPQWNARGGYGILHTSAERSLKDLTKYLAQL